MEIGEECLTQVSLNELWEKWFSYLDPLSDKQVAILTRVWSECPMRLITIAFRVADERLPVLPPKRAKYTQEEAAIQYITGVLRNSMIGEARKADVDKGLTPKAEWSFNKWGSPNEYEKLFPNLFDKGTDPDQCT